MCEVMRRYEDIARAAGRAEGRAEGMQQGMQQGIQQGMQQGMQQGKAEERALIRERMLLAGIPAEQIAALLS